jgi:hypothetical protein
MSQSATNLEAVRAFLQRLHPDRVFFTTGDQPKGRYFVQCLNHPDGSRCEDHEPLKTSKCNIGYPMKTCAHGLPVVYMISNGGSGDEPELVGNARYAAEHFAATHLGETRE